MLMAAPVSLAKRERSKICDVLSDVILPLPNVCMAQISSHLNIVTGFEEPNRAHQSADTRTNYADIQLHVICSWCKSIRRRHPELMLFCSCHNRRGIQAFEHVMAKYTISVDCTHFPQFQSTDKLAWRAAQYTLSQCHVRTRSDPASDTILGSTCGVHIFLRPSTGGNYGEPPPLHSL